MPAAVLAAGAFNHRFRCSQRKSREPAEQTATNRHWARGNLVVGDGAIGPGNHWNVLQRVDQIDKVTKRETVVAPERRTLLAGADVRRRCAGGVRADPGRGHRIESSHTWTPQSKVRANNFLIGFNALTLEWVAPRVPSPAISALGAARLAGSVSRRRRLGCMGLRSVALWVNAF